jgi:hypothetical protein
MTINETPLGIDQPPEPAICQLCDVLSCLRRLRHRLLCSLVLASKPTLLINWLRYHCFLTVGWSSLPIMSHLTSPTTFEGKHWLAVALR